LKQFIKNIIPDFIKAKLKKLITPAPESAWLGDYATWEDASKP